MGRNKGTCVPTRQTPAYSAEYWGRVPLSPADKNISLFAGFCQGEEIKQLSVIPGQIVNLKPFKFGRPFYKNGRRRGFSFNLFYKCFQAVKLFFREVVFCFNPFAFVFVVNPEVSVFFNYKPCIGFKNPL